MSSAGPSLHLPLLSILKISYYSAAFGPCLHSRLRPSPSSTEASSSEISPTMTSLFSPSTSDDRRAVISPFPLSTNDDRRATIDEWWLHHSRHRKEKIDERWLQHFRRRRKTIDELWLHHSCCRQRRTMSAYFTIPVVDDRWSTSVFPNSRCLIYREFDGGVNRHVIHYI